VAAQRRDLPPERRRPAAEQPVGLRVQRRSKVYAPLWLERPKPEASADHGKFRQERNCYVCKKSFSKMHRYYDSMCDACGDFNCAKREQTADLSGHYALVTGARVKIGFQASLKLLRAGAHVVVTRPTLPNVRPAQGGPRMSVVLHCSRDGGRTSVLP